MPVTRLRLLTADEAAWYLSVTEGWVRTAAAAGRLPAVRVGRRLRFRAEDLDTWIEANSTTPPVRA